MAKTENTNEINEIECEREKTNQIEDKKNGSQSRY